MAKCKKKIIRINKEGQFHRVLQKRSGSRGFSWLDKGIFLNNKDALKRKRSLEKC